MSTTARYLVSAAVEARNASIAAVEARYRDRLRHAAQLDGIPLTGAGAIGFDEDGNWTAEVPAVTGGDCGCGDV